MDHPQTEIQESSGFVPGMIVGAIVGGLIGAAAALWFAPQAGEETQSKLREGAVRLKERADETLGEVRANVEGASEKVREKVEGATHEGQNFVYKQAQKAGHAAADARSASQNAIGR